MQCVLDRVDVARWRARRLIIRAEVSSMLYIDVDPRLTGDFFLKLCCVFIA